MEYYYLYLKRDNPVFDGETSLMGKLYLSSCDSDVLKLEDNEVLLQSSHRFICDTLEPSPYNEIHPPIPVGKYTVTMNIRSPRFRRYLPRLLNVPHRSGILIHEGNTVADTSGCILVGKKERQSFLSNSRNTLNKVSNIIYKYCVGKIYVY